METPAQTDIKLEAGWKAQLASEVHQPYFQELRDFLAAEKKQYTIYPKGGHIFRAFEVTPFDQTKVVIIGQDPYHGEGQAEGLSFSVAPGVKPPPSLVNIYKELREDLGFTIPNHGHLIHWARQGVLLLNSVLTVRANQPASHRNKGWEKFTDEAIRQASAHKEHLVFLLWGKYAQDKAILIDPNKHLILKAAHPSPYSAAAGFFGCKHFSTTNAYLISKGLEPINWQLPL
jgi:uracil-DNA glycosylase